MPSALSEVNIFALSFNVRNVFHRKMFTGIEKKLMVKMFNVTQNRAEGSSKTI